MTLLTNKPKPVWAKFRRHFSTGGELVSVPKPHVRYYSLVNPHKPKRGVKISVMKYYGAGTHYYVSIKEDDNPIWNAKEHCWHYPADDVKGRGRDFEQKFNTLLEAKLFVRDKLKKHFPLSTHKPTHDWDNLVEPERKVWFGRFKEGD